MPLSPFLASNFCLLLAPRDGCEARPSAEAIWDEPLAPRLRPAPRFPDSVAEPKNVFGVSVLAPFVAWLAGTFVVAFPNSTLLVDFLDADWWPSPVLCFRMPSEVALLIKLRAMLDEPACETALSLDATLPALLRC